MLTVTEVETRVLRACRTIRALPDPDRRFLVDEGNSWPETVREVAESYGYDDAIMPKFRPSPADVGDCLVALAWCRVLSKREFRLIWWRSFGISFRHIGLRIGRSDEMARQRYRDARLKVWQAAMPEVVVQMPRPALPLAFCA